MGYTEAADRRGQSMTQFVVECVEKEIDRNKKSNEMLEDIQQDLEA